MDLYADNIGGFKEFHPFRNVDGYQKNIKLFTRKYLTI